MKTKTIFFLLIFVIAVSCRKEESNNENLLPKYQSIFDVWKPLTITYDSSGIKVTQPLLYDRLVIYNSLSYEVYLDTKNPAIEDGSVRIISQTEDSLEIYFAAVYPSYSSYSGSHIFGHSNVIFDSIVNDTLTFKSTGNFYYQNAEFSFKRY